MPRWSRTSLLVVLLAGLAGPAAAAKRAPQERPARKAGKKAQKAPPQREPAENPGQAGELRDQGFELYEKRQYDQAIEAWERAYKIEPTPRTLYNIASAHRKAGRAQPAIVTYERYLKAEPLSELRPEVDRYLAELRGRVEEDRANALLDKNDYEGAVAAWEAAYRHSPLPIYRFKQAESNRLAGRTPEALAAYDAFLAKDPPAALKAEALRYAAELRAKLEEQRATRLLEKKLFEAAIEAWEAAYRQKPVPLYLFRVAQAQQRVGRLREARRNYERVLQEEPETQLRGEIDAALIELQALLEGERAERLYQGRQYDKAAKAWAGAYQIRSMPAFLFYQARALLQAGKREEALTLFEEFLQQKEAPRTGLVLEAQRQVTDLRELLTVQRNYERSRRPPLYRRAWFWGVLAGVVAAGAGIGAGIYTGMALNARDTRDLSTDLGFARLP